MTIRINTISYTRTISVVTDRIALNVGINRFRNEEGMNLRGCVADVKNFSNILTRHFGFSEGDIIELIDEQATKANIIDTFKSIIRYAKQGRYSYVILKLSTYGTQIRGIADPEEEEHMDEAFVPYDVRQVGDDWDIDTIIVDDELAKIVSALPRNVLFEGFGDTCHSGMGVRNLHSREIGHDRFALEASHRESPSSANQVSRRYVEPKRRSTSSTSFAGEEDFLPKHGIDRALADENMKNHVWWSSCKDSQTTADADIEGAGWNGAFTYYLCDVIRREYRQETGPSRGRISNLVRSALYPSYNQSPELHCSKIYERFPIASWEE